jgi:hypothetical protein
VVVIRPRKGGDGVKYTVPISVMPKLGEINKDDPAPAGARRPRTGRQVGGPPASARGLTDP